MQGQAGLTEVSARSICGTGAGSELTVPLRSPLAASSAATRTWSSEDKDTGSEAVRHETHLQAHSRRQDRGQSQLQCWAPASGRRPPAAVDCLPLGHAGRPAQHGKLSYSRYCALQKSRSVTGSSPAAACASGPTREWRGRPSGWREAWSERLVCRRKVLWTCLYSALCP